MEENVQPAKRWRVWGYGKKTAHLCSKAEMTHNGKPATYITLCGLRRDFWSARDANERYPRCRKCAQSLQPTCDKATGSPATEVREVYAPAVGEWVLPSPQSRKLHRVRLIGVTIDMECPAQCVPEWVRPASKNPTAEKCEWCERIDNLYHERDSLMTQLNAEADYQSLLSDERDAAFARAEKAEGQLDDAHHLIMAFTNPIGYGDKYGLHENREWLIDMLRTYWVNYPDAERIEVPVATTATELETGKGEAA